MRPQKPATFLILSSKNYELRAGKKAAAKKAIQSGGALAIFMSNGYPRLLSDKAMKELPWIILARRRIPNDGKWFHATPRGKYGHV